MDFNDFSGDWHLSRVIHDETGLGKGEFQGAAVFHPTAAGFRYQEEGTLRFPGQSPMAATQSYLWHRTLNGAEVLFSDGRAFHHVALTGAAAQAQHFCAPDDYQVSYDFSLWPIWVSTWHVVGPRKNYVMRTTYVR